MHPSDERFVGLTRQLVAIARGIEPSQLPTEVVERTKDLVADHLGVALRAFDEPWTRIVRDQAISEGAVAVAAIYDGGGTSVRNAALVNGTAGHALELDDTHERSLTHPGAVVIPAALAVAQHVGASGARTIAAIVAGYEVQCRLGAHIGQALIERGMHPTASLGVFGAAAAAGHLLRLDEQAMTWAFGIAASMSAGLMQFSQDASGTMVKRLYGGMPAERGVLAAQLAAAGYTGPRASLEGRFGVARVLADRDIAAVTEPAGGAFVVSEVSIKLYACCRNFHALIDATFACRKAGPIDVDAIERIEVRGPRAMIDHHLERRPRSAMAAQYSLPFTTAVALAGDPADPASFGDEARDDPMLLSIADRVEAIYDDAFQRAFPKHFGGAIAIVFRDGTRIERRVLDSKGTPVHPADRATIHAKFEALTRHRLDTSAQRRLLDVVAHLDALPALDALVDALPDREAHADRRAAD